MTDEECNHTARDALTGAIINLHEARIQLESGSLGRADESLAVAQRLMLQAGAKDIGQFPNGRDLEDNVLSDLYRLRERLEQKEQRIEELEDEVKQPKSDEDNSGLFSFIR